MYSRGKRVDGDAEQSNHDENKLMDAISLWRPRLSEGLVTRAIRGGSLQRK
mgnify:CR=1 FL=1